MSKKASRRGGQQAGASREQSAGGVETRQARCSGTAATVTRGGGTLAAAQAVVPALQTAAAEARCENLLLHLQPSFASEVRRLAVAEYVCGIIRRCFFPRQVEAFMFGSVPLRTVLPDGDVDISMFCAAPGPTPGGGPGGYGGVSLRETWALELQRALEREQASPNQLFTIADVHVIQAEVRLVKCIVADLVVDISYDTLGGLCTVAFLEAVDRRIGCNHLFKRSIVLVKAWCYYESRLLGAHHGLISSYALETMVLYVINVHHAELATPLEVLRKFLQVFAAFPWEKHCLSIHGPIPLRSFPHPTVDGDALPPGGLLLDEEFMSQALQAYSVRPSAMACMDGSSVTTSTVSATSGTTGTTVGYNAVAPTFPLKHLNVVDPLLPSNNLGRSVSRASFARIRQAFLLGARTLDEAVAKDTPQAAVEAVDAFFKNTWRSPLRTSGDNQLFLHRLGTAAGSGFAGSPASGGYGTCGHGSGGGTDNLTQLMVSQQQQALGAAAAQQAQQRLAAALSQQQQQVAASTAAQQQTQQRVVNGVAAMASGSQAAPFSGLTPQESISRAGVAADSQQAQREQRVAQQPSSRVGTTGQPPQPPPPTQQQAQAQVKAQAGYALQLQNLVALTRAQQPPGSAGAAGLYASAYQQAAGLGPGGASQAALGLTLHSLLASAQFADALAGDLATLSRNLRVARVAQLVQQQVAQQMAAVAQQQQQQHWQGQGGGYGSSGRGAPPRGDYRQQQAASMQTQAQPVALAQTQPLQPPSGVQSAHGSNISSPTLAHQPTSAALALGSLSLDGAGSSGSTSATASAAAGTASGPATSGQRRSKSWSGQAPNAA